MGDSRLASMRVYLKKKSWPLSFKLSALLGIFAVAYIANEIVQANGIPDITAHALFLLIFAAGLWITEAIPPFAVSILVIGFSIYFLDDLHFQVISKDWQKYLSTWSSPIIWILLGGFFLAIGAQITRLDRRLSRFILSRFGTKPDRILLGCMLTTGIFSMFMSNTATTAMMVAILAPLVQKLDPKDAFVKVLFIGVAAAATVGGMGTIIGSPPNAIAVGLLQNQGIDFGFTQWMMLGAPLALGFIMLIWGLLKLYYKTDYQHLELEMAHGEAPDEPRNTPGSRFIVVATFVITIGLWLSSPLHNIPVAVVSLLPIVAFSVTGVVGADDLKMLPWDTLILVAGGLTLGMVISDAGLAEYLVAQIPVFQNVFVMLLILGWLTTLLSNIMSNTAAASVLIPVGASLLPEQALLVSLVIGFSASTALFLPISTPPNAIAFSTGFVRQSDFRYLGTIIGLSGPVLIILIIMFFMG